MTMGLYGPKFFAGRSGPVRASAAVVVPHLMDMLQPQSVLDVGCGQGEWLEAFGRDVDRFGVDIAIEDSPPGFLFHDLTEPLELGITFDLVLCLEVGEHLPEDASDTLIDSLIRHSDTIVFGAAVPGQEGIGHINCQPHDYWHAKFGDRGYDMYDTIRPLVAGDPHVSPWYRDNMFLYRRSL